MQIFAVSIPHFKTVSVHSWVFCGSAYENTKNNGISHFLEHMMFRGNRHLGNSYQVNYAFESLGGDINASTTSDITEYWFSFHKKHLEQGISRFCRFLQAPLMESLELERSIILEEIKADYNDEDKLINTISLSSAALWPNQPMGLPVIGNPDSIHSISLDDLKNWHQSYYQPANMIFGVAGDLDVDHLIEQISNEFESIPAGKRSQYDSSDIRPKKEEQIILVEHRDNQFNLQWSFPVLELNPELKTALNVMVRALDDGFCSRLQKEIREEKGLVYDISGSMEFLIDQAIFSIQAVVSEEKLEELLQTLTELIRNLQKEGLTDEEWELTKSRYESALDTYSDSPQGVLYEKVLPLIYPGSLSAESTLKQLEKLEKERVDQVMSECLGTKSSVFVGVGPFKKQQKTAVKKYLQEWML